MITPTSSLNLNNLVAGQNQIVQAINALANNVGGLSNHVVIPPNSITQNMLVSGLSAVQLVTALPNPAGYTGSSIVLWLTDPIGYPQLWRYDPSVPQWVVEVPSTSITGQLQDSQIAAVAAAKLTGQITTTQITNNAITTPLLAAGSVTTAVLAAASVTAGNVAANAITAGAIAAGAVTAGTIAANAVTAGTIASNAVTAGTIAAGAVTATKISVANLAAINADLGTITAGTLNAAVVFAGTIAASQILAGTLSAFTIQTAGSGARLIMSPGVFFNGYNASNTQTISCSPNFLGGFPIFSVSNPSAALFASLGGVAPVVGINDGTFTEAGHFTGVNSASDAIRCPVGGITISNGYLAMGGGNITGLGASITSTASTLFINAGTNVTFDANILLNTDNTFTVGSPSFRASVVYSAGGVVTTSDERMKTNINPETLGLAFINGLKPVSYNWKTDASSVPVRHGLLAQDVQAALNGASFAGLDMPTDAGVPEGMTGGCSIDGMTPYGLNYPEFIGPMIKAIQELSAEVAALKAA
jgi:hypothetical protein